MLSNNGRQISETSLFLQFSLQRIVFDATSMYSSRETTLAICKLTIINSEILASFKLAQKLKDFAFRIRNLVLQLHHKNNQFLSTSGFKTHSNKLWWEYSNCFSYCCVLFHLDCAQTNKNMGFNAGNAMLTLILKWMVLCLIPCYCFETKQNKDSKIKCLILASTLRLKAISFVCRVPSASLN